jgi:hypothetical protein
LPFSLPFFFFFNHELYLFSEGTGGSNHPLLALNKKSAVTNKQKEKKEGRGRPGV